MGETTQVTSRESANPTGTTPRQGITFDRYFTKPKVSPYDELEWELRTASIANEKGKVIFEQRNVETPKSWSQTATNIVASKYFHGKLGTPQRESSARQLISRVLETIMADPAVAGVLLSGLFGGYAIRFDPRIADAITSSRPASQHTNERTAIHEQSPSRTSEDPRVAVAHQQVPGEPAEGPASRESGRVAQGRGSAAQPARILTAARIGIIGAGRPRPAPTGTR